MNTLNTIKNRLDPGAVTWRYGAALLLLLMLVPFLSRSVMAQEVYVPESDSLALVAFYNSMSGDHWKNNGGWLVDRVDTWHGISTKNVGSDAEPEWRVVKIAFSNNMTQPGTLPPELGNLEYLEDLVLRDDPALYGEWPKEIGNIRRMNEIRTQDTNMSGEIPWVDLVRADIRRIRLQSAKHVGEIPDEIFGQLNRLQRIEISYQYISGSIPPSAASLSSLRRFRLQGNLLTGEVPDMGDINGIEQFHINGNPLDPGPVWPWLQNWAESLEELRIDNTNRTGTVPEWLSTAMFKLGELTIGEQSWDLENALGGELPDMSALLELEELHVHGPHWTGGLPDWAGAMEMNRLMFYYCSLEGGIPASYVNVKDQLAIEHCPGVTGGLPAEFELFSGRDFQIVMSDSWEDRYDRFGEEAAAFFRNPQMQMGEIPDYIGNWGAREITLVNVGLTGTIPATITNNAGLERLNLSNNPNLTGTLPAGLFNLPLSTFIVSHTGLTIPELPAELVNLSLSLTDLGMAGLGMGGTLPSAIGDFPLLQSLDLSDNNITGPIPVELGSLPLIVSLNLADNQFEGELPATFEEIGYLSGFYTLNHLDLSGNEELTGELPPRFSTAALMKVMRYNDTKLWAPDNVDFLDWLDNVIPSNYGLSFPPVYVDVQTSGYIGKLPTSIDEPVEQAFLFHLGSNYPNPFNPGTTISYEIPADGHVTMSIYNVIGQHVATLVDEVMTAGSYQVTFDAGSLSSGTYLYRLKSGNHVATRSMTLVK